MKDETFIENAIEWLTTIDDAYVTFSQKKFRNKIRKLAETNTEVEIISDDEDCTYAKIPVEWISVRKPKQMNLSDERRAGLAERLKKSKSAVKK